jgi:hypothetical protein
MTELLDRIEDRPPFRHDLAGNERLEAGDQRGHHLTFLPGVNTGLVLGQDPGELLMVWPVAVARHVNRHHRETALGHEPAGTAHDARFLLMPSAAVTHQDQRTSTDGTFWRPQHAGNLTEGKQLFNDAAGRRLRGEPHGDPTY